MATAGPISPRQSSLRFPLKHWFSDLFPGVCGISQTRLTIFQQKKESSFMASFACPAWIFPLVNPLSVQDMAPVHRLKLQMRQGSICALDLLLKEAEKDLFRGFRGDIDFFFPSDFAKMHFLTSTFWNSTGEAMCLKSCCLFWLSCAVVSACWTDYRHLILKPPPKKQVKPETSIL